MRAGYADAGPLGYEAFSKAVAAGTTMAGTTIVLGVIPLVIVHLIGFAILCP